MMPYCIVTLSSCVVYIILSVGVSVQTFLVCVCVLLFNFSFVSCRSYDSTANQGVCHRKA